MRQDVASLMQANADHVLHPFGTVGHPSEPLIIARGEGALVWDVQENRYVDGTCGLWQCAVGHGRRELAEVAAAQIGELEFYASFWDYANVPSIRLAERLISLAPDGIRQVFFTSGGSEGNDTAIKLARLAHQASGKPDRTIILSRASAYHGVAGLSLAASGFERLKASFGPPAPGFHHLSEPHARPDDPGGTDRLVEELESTIRSLGAERIAAFIGEPVLGVGGMVPPPPGYWPRIEEVLRRHGILLIIDEVITAFGRSGHWFASDGYGVRPDLIVTAKGLSSGYFPMGAVLIGERVLELADGAVFQHGFTYNGHPVGAAVSLANLDIIEREALLGRATAIGERMQNALAPLRELPHVAEVRGAGLMVGIELSDGDAAMLQARCRRDGVIVRAAGNAILLSPPLVITEEQADRLTDVVAEHARAIGGDRHG